MATVSNFLFIVQGTSATQTSAFTLLSPGAEGNPAALRQLVHPDAVNFPAITYRLNPDRTTNFVRGRVAAPPLANVRRTLGQAVVTRFDRTVRDMIVGERWVATTSKVAMVANFLVELLNYLNNPPAFNPASPQFIRWRPRDGGLYEYDVELVSVTVGGFGDEEPIDLLEVGLPNPPTLAGPLTSIDGTLPTGLVDRTVELTMRVVEEFPLAS